MVVEKSPQSSAILRLIETSLGVHCLDLIFESRESLGKLGNTLACDASLSELADPFYSHNLSGNPLELQQLADLSMESKLVVNSEKESGYVSKFFDFTRIKPLSCLPAGGYQDRFVYYISEDQHQLFGLFPLSNTSKRILRVKLETDPNVQQTIEAVQQLHMAFFPTFQCELEATYDFSCATFTARYDTCGGELLSPPLPYVTGNLTIEVDVYTSDWLSPVLLDLNILKNMYSAYMSDCFTWNVGNAVFAFDTFRDSLSDVFGATTLKPIEIPIGASQHAILRSVLAKRSLDSTELLWNAIKGAPTRQECRRALGCALSYLLDHRELLKLHHNNDTELAARIRSLISRPGPVDANSLHTTAVGVEYLLEIGLNKLLNDCLCLLEYIIPGWTPLQSAEQKRTWDLEHRWAQLHHLYKCCCLLMVLSSYCSKEAFLPHFRKILNQPDPDDEWRTSIFGDASTNTLVIRHNFNLLVSELLVPVSSTSPTLWIMRLDADHPTRARICLVYERVSWERTDKYVCYVMQLIDSYVPPPISEG